MDEKKSVFVSCERIGDLLVSMPLLFQWRKTFPLSAITLAVSERAAPILPFLNGYDDSIVIPRSPGGRRDITLKTVWETRRKRKNDFDTAVSCLPRYSSHVSSYLWSFKAKKRVAVVKKKWHSGFGQFIHQPVYEKQLNQKPIHHGLACLNILFPQFEKIPSVLYPRLSLPKTHSLFNIPGLQKLLNYDETPIIFISVSNNRDYCFLGIKKYVEVLQALFLKERYRLVISCMGGDSVFARAIVNRLLAPSCVVETPKFVDLLQLLNRSDLVFVGDGGLAHMAAALDKPQVALFITRKVIRWHPLSKKTFCLHHPDHVLKIPNNEIVDALLDQLSEMKKYNG